MKIFILFSCTLNSGDAAILLSTISSLKKEFGKDAKIVVASHQALTAKKYYKNINYIKFSTSLKDIILKKGKFRIPRNYFLLFYQYIFRRIPKILLKDLEIKILKNIKNSDIIIAPGGGYVTDSYYLQFSLLLFNYILALKKKLYFYAQSIGPFWKKSTCKILEKIFLRANFILMRDKKSLNNLERLLGKIPNNAAVTADEAFTFCEIRDRGKTINKKVGISVRDWNFSNINKSYKESISNYKNNLKKIAEFLIREHDYNITFISTCQGQKEYIDDSIIATDIHDMIEKNLRKKVAVNNDFHTPKDLIKIFSEFDFFIGTRMHSIILNFLNLNPCLGIIYEFKTEELFKRISLEEYLFNMHSDNYKLLLRKLKNLIKNLNLIKSRLKIEVPKLQRIANKNIKYIKNDYFNKSSKKIR